MYAIVDIAGQQFKVTKAQKLKVHRLEAEEGKTVELANVLLVSDGKTINVGTPSLDGFRIAAKVLSHSKGDKVLVFKKKRRKGYQKLNGHAALPSYGSKRLGKGEKFDASKSSAPKVMAMKVAQPVKKSAVPVKEAAPKKGCRQEGCTKKGRCQESCSCKEGSTEKRRQEVIQHPRDSGSNPE